MCGGIFPISACSDNVHRILARVHRAIKSWTPRERIFPAVPIFPSNEHTANSPSREETCAIAAQMADAEIVSLVNSLIDAGDIGSLERVREAQVGTVQLQVREPICHERFILADALVTIAEVIVDGSVGWAMRLGANIEAATAAAVLDGWLADHTDGAPTKKRVIDSLLSAQRRDSYERNVMQQEVLATAIEFEELD